MVGMKDSPESKQAALDNLRTWRSWFDRRDPLIYAAHLVGASLAEIRDASGVAVNTARAAIASQEKVVTAATADRLAKYHHPHFVSVEPGRFEGQFTYTWKPFTGHESEPTRPDASYRDESLSNEDRRALSMEYRAAREMWGTARFHLLARPQVTRMAPAWEAYRQARTAMNDAFEALLSTPDNAWRAQIMKLTDLHRDALKAAKQWDEFGKKLAEIYDEYDSNSGPHNIGRLEDEIADYPTDTQGWELYHLSEYQPSSYSSRSDEFLLPSVKTVTEEIKHHKARIREVSDLTGKPDQN